MQDHRVGGVSEEAKRMRLFPFSLEGNAQKWYKGQGLEKIGTWAILRHGFIKKYFSPQKEFDLKNQILRLKEDPKRHCHNHGGDWDLVERCPQMGVLREYQVCVLYMKSYRRCDIWMLPLEVGSFTWNHKPIEIFSS